MPGLFLEVKRVFSHGMTEEQAFGEPSLIQAFVMASLSIFPGRVGKVESSVTLFSCH